MKYLDNNFKETLEINFRVEEIVLSFYRKVSNRLCHTDKANEAQPLPPIVVSIGGIGSNW